MARLTAITVQGSRSRWNRRYDEAENSVVSVSHETPLETESRLRTVLAGADFEALPGFWAYHQYPAGQPPQPAERSLAMVRDDSGWCGLEPAHGDEPEIFGIFAVHFPAGQDNSGFVGWLATELKQHLGTGVAVLCGYNRARGGVYDYWLAPHELRDQVIEHVRRLATPDT